jgi:hypothetical protein
MNKFARLDLGFKALLGRKTTVTAETSVQLSLDWDNFSFSEEEQAIWEEMVRDAAQDQFCCEDCGKKGLFYWGYCPECEEKRGECPCQGSVEDCSRCAPIDLENSEWETPITCKGCGYVEKKYGMGDFCRDCKVNGTERTLRGGNDTGTPNTSTDTNLDLDGIDDLLFECPCAGTGGICKSCLKINNAHSE